ncbi:MAG: hypothetical protein HYZ28_21670 [Myxococcales bacterium]|nr:hypothetical protein [Myxococcales bacterium]
MRSETLVDKDLVVEIDDQDQVLEVRWRGTSMDREPGRFLMPLFKDMVDRCRGVQKKLVLDLARMDYMNSSTFAPIVKMLDEAVRAGVGVQLLYDSSRRWQVLSFSALKVFETADGRVQIRAK